MKSILTSDTLEPFFIPFDEAPEEVWGGAGVEVMVVSILHTVSLEIGSAVGFKEV